MYYVYTIHILVAESVKIPETTSMYSYLQREAKDFCFPTAPISGSNSKREEIEKVNKLMEISIVKKKATTR